MPTSDLAAKQTADREILKRIAKQPFMVAFRDNPGEYKDKVKTLFGMDLFDQVAAVYNPTLHRNIATFAEEISKDIRALANGYNPPQHIL